MGGVQTNSSGGSAPIQQKVGPNSYKCSVSTEPGCHAAPQITARGNGAQPCSHGAGPSPGAPTGAQALQGQGHGAPHPLPPPLGPAPSSRSALEPNVPVAPGTPRACSRLSAEGPRSAFVLAAARRGSRRGSPVRGATATQRPLAAAGPRLGPARAAAADPRAEPRPAARRSRRRPGACGSARRRGRKRRSFLLLLRRRHPGGAPASGRPRRPRSHGLGGRAAAAARGAREGGGGGARPAPAEPGGAGWCRGTGAAGASGREGPGRDPTVPLRPGAVPSGGSAARGGAERRSVSDRSARRRPRCVSRENQFSGVPAAPSARRAGFALGYRAVGKLTRSQTALRGGRGPRGRPAPGHRRHGGAAPRPVLGRGRPGSGGRCRAASSLPYRREFIVTKGEMDRFLSELASPLLGTRVGCVPAAGRSLRARAEPRAFPVAGCGAALPGGARGCLAAARAARSSDGGAEPDGPS